MGINGFGFGVNEELADFATIGADLLVLFLTTSLEACLWTCCVWTTAGVVVTTGVVGAHEASAKMGMRSGNR